MDGFEKRLLLLSLVVVMFLVAGSVFAQSDYPRDISFSWVNASQYEDGSLIDAGDLTQVRIECFRNNATSAILVELFTVTGEGLPQSEVVVGGIPQPGTYSCVGYSIIFDGTESVASAATVKKFTGKPRPPADVVME